MCKGPGPVVLDAPATRNMSAAQLQAAVDLSNGIAMERADLVALDARSLEVRGKAEKKARAGRRKMGDVEEDHLKRPEIGSSSSLLKKA